MPFTETLTDMQVRVLGCLIEKKATTPDQYPLTLNALKTACNQKTSRHPVVDYSDGEVGHTVRELEALDLVRENWGARVARYEHLADKALDLLQKELAVLCVLMLRGPQTASEIRAHSQRLFAFDDVDDVEYVLDRLARHEPPLSMELPRQAGQKGQRHCHLLCGEPDPEVLAAAAAAAPPRSGLEQRISELEQRVAELESLLSDSQDGSES